MLMSSAFSSAVLFILAQAPAAPAATDSGSLSSVLISGILGGGGVAIIGALFKGYSDLRKLRSDEGKVKIENSKAIEEATSSVVSLLNTELKDQADRFNQTIRWLEQRRQELMSDNLTLEQRCDRLEKRLNELANWKSGVESILHENNLAVPVFLSSFEG
jgi:TolA-binding protein